MSYLQRWSEDLFKKPAMALKSIVRVEGVRDAHLGPRLEFAKVVMTVEPATNFEAVFELGAELSLDQRRFLESAVFGFLDVAMTEDLQPFRNVRITIIGAEFDPINASMVAFRRAGRDAAKKLFQQIRHS